MDERAGGGSKMGESDKFGVPLRFFGPHPDAVWGAIGRTVSVSALLEDRLLTLLQRLGSKRPTVYARLGPAGLLDELEKVAPSDEEVWDGCPLWLAEVRKGFEWRNDVVHNLWPAQPGDRLYGHRVDQRTGMRRTTDTTTDELPRRLHDLVMLVDQWENWFALANSPLRRTR